MSAYIEARNRLIALSETMPFTVGVEACSAVLIYAWKLISPRGALFTLQLMKEPEYSAPAEWNDFRLLYQSPREVEEYLYVAQTPPFPSGIMPFYWQLWNLGNDGKGVVVDVYFFRIP